MKTINQTPASLAATIALGALVAFTLPLSSVHALSCLNPAEMVDDYVADAQFSVALVEAGEVETVGDEHDQSVTVKELYKGTVNDTVTFEYDETWQYLCAGGPVEAGSEAVYVTTDERVVQVINLDTELYKSLMTALKSTPEVSNPEPVIEAKRTLMQRVIDLLQQLVGLFRGESVPSPVEPTPVVSMDAIVGMTAAEAEVYAAANDTPFRVVEIDGEPQPTTKDYRPGRINASMEEGVVVRYTVEGEAVEEEVQEESGLHDQIIGMSQVEAEAYADENEVPFRIGRLDGEYLALTMDYRPGRITAEIEDGVVVDYSVE